MSAPSPRHEQRVVLLEDLADLAGYGRRIDVYDRLRPDVCRLHFATSSILVADAKASESPEDCSSHVRLSAYARAALQWVDAGFVVSFAVCHDVDPSGRWSQLLASLVHEIGRSVSRQTYAVLDDDTAVTAVTVDRGRRRALSVTQPTFPKPPAVRRPAA